MNPVLWQLTAPEIAAITRALVDLDRTTAELKAGRDVVTHIPIGGDADTYWAAHDVLENAMFAARDVVNTLTLALFPHAMDPEFVFLAEQAVLLRVIMA